MNPSTSPPAVSVVIPTYNRADQLATALEALARVEVPLEIIVVDDGSRDRSRQVAVSWSKVVYQYQENAGPSSARSHGLSLATAEWVHFHDVDDSVGPEFYSLNLRHAEADPSIDVWVCGRQESPSGDRIAQKPIPNDAHEALHAQLEGSFGPTIQYMVRREAALRAGPWSQDMSYSEDWEWWLRVAGRGGRFALSDHFHATYHNSPGSLSKQTLRMYRGGMEALRRAAAHHPGCDECRKARMHGLRAIRRSTAAELVNQLAGPTAYQALKGIAVSPELYFEVVGAVARKLAGRLRRK